jgi:hypothetical protein
MTTENGGVERRGMDPGTISFIKALHEQFVETHSAVHDVYVADHERDHQRFNETLQREVALAATRIHEITSTIKAHYDSLLTERNARYDERHKAAQNAIDAALLASKEAREAALAATKEAIIKSENSQKEVNAATYVTISELQKNLGMAMPRSEVQARFEAQGELITALTKSVNDIAAERRGSSSFGTTLIALGGFAVLAIGLILTIFHTR